MICVRAGISYALTEAMDKGHCGLPANELMPLAVALLEVSGELVRTALDRELAGRAVVAGMVGETACIFTACIFLAGLYRAEQVIAERLLRLANGTLSWPYIDPEKALPWIERKTGLRWPQVRSPQSGWPCCPRGTVKLPRSSPCEAGRLSGHSPGRCCAWPPRSPSRRGSRRPPPRHAAAALRAGSRSSTRGC
jgi:hypothetical protein